MTTHFYKPTQDDNKSYPEYNIPGVPEIGEDIVVLLLDVGEEAGVVHDGVHEAHVTGEALLTAQRPNLDWAWPGPD